MANNIKGITIEIDANPTPLNNALKQIDSKTRSLTSELTQINRQLKFDPHNAVLLQQKFTVLSEKVEQTRERLKTLKDAQEQVDQQFKEGKIPEEEYRAFQREVALTESQLKTFEQQMEDAKKDLDNLGNEADETGGDFKEMGNDAQSSSKKVGDGFNTTAINLSAVTNIVRNIGSVIQSAIQSAINLGRKIGEIVKDYLNRADEINTNAKKYGIDTDTLQGWMYASELLDVSSDTIGSSMSKITRSLKQYDNGTKDTVKAYESLGVAVKNASGSFRSQEDIFYDVIDALGKLDDETQADIYSNQIFGRSFQELEPLVYAGSDAIKDLSQEAKDMGVIMPPEQLDAMNNAKDSLDRLHYQLGTLLAPVIEALAPHIESLAKWLSEKLASPTTQEVLEKIATAVSEMAEAIGGAILDLVESGTLEDLINALVDFLPILTDFIKNSLPALVEGLSNVLGFLTGMIEPVETFDERLAKAKDGVNEFSSEGQITAGLMKKAWDNAYNGKGGIGYTITEALDRAGISHEEFIKKCEGEGGLGGLVAKNYVVWEDIKTKIGEKMGEAWDGITTWFSNVGTWFSELPGKISSWVSSIPEKIKSVFESAFGKIKEWGESIGEWFRDLPNKIWKWIKDIPKTIARAFSGKVSTTIDGGRVTMGYNGQYAEGGIFKKSSFVNIGEAGPEVVLPLDRLGQVLSSVGYRGTGSIVVNAPIQVVKELNDAEINRVGGRLSDIVGRQFAKRTGGVL